ncbi:MAG: YceI family protein [Ferruginibacter sp.]|nr:YceI family protein [Ferruginibacter sp.]
MKKIFLAFVICTATLAKAQNFIPTDDGSKLHFVIKNFGINTGGDLTGLKGKIIFDAKNTNKCFFDVTVSVKTIDTDNGKRDEHLRKEEYFDVATYPVLHLVSTKIEPGADLKHFIFKGNLTIKNITKPISFPFTAEGKTGGAFFVGSFDINRGDFGGGKVSFSLSNKIKVTLNAFAKTQ